MCVFGCVCVRARNRNARSCQCLVGNKAEEEAAAGGEAAAGDELIWYLQARVSPERGGEALALPGQRKDV